MGVTGGGAGATGAMRGTGCEPEDIGVGGGAGTPLLVGGGWAVVERCVPGGSVPGGTGAVILTESCEPSEDTEWEELREALEL